MVSSVVALTVLSVYHLLIVLGGSSRPRVSPSRLP